LQFLNLHQQILLVFLLAEDLLRIGIRKDLVPSCGSRGFGSALASSERTVADTRVRYRILS